MKYIVIACAAAATLFGAAAGAQTDVTVATIHALAKPERPGLGELWQLIDSAERAMADAEYQHAADLFDTVLAATAFPALDSERRHYVLSSAANIASMHSDFERARALYTQSSELAMAGSDDWMGRLNAAWFLGDLDDAVASLGAIAHQWPEELAFVSEWAMDSLLLHARAQNTNTELAVLKALFDTGWQTDLGREPTRIWLRLIELLAEDNAIESALSVSSRIRDPLAIVTLLSDRKFAPIVAAAPDWFNVEETMDAGIIEARLAVEANPHLLAPSIDLAEALLRAGRQPEALLVLESHMARSALKSVIGGTLEDAVAETVRALTVKALALVALQRYDDAAAQLDLAANQVLPKDRAGDFLAVAQLQVRLGLPDAALATLERLAGLAQDARADLVRFMAARSHSDTDAQNAALAALIAGAGDAPAEAQRALLLAGRIDAAADLLIRRLNDPLQRSNALLELQRMHEQVWPETAVDWRRRAAQLMSREDVRASVAASGGIVADYALYRWN